MVVGAPLGLDATVTNGIVSALRTQDGHQYLQFSAPISPGNSGGPVVDSHGRVVGIAVSKYVGDNAEGLSFAVPVAKLCSGLNVC
jgi:S1-C subfamily serine protease